MNSLRQLWSGVVLTGILAAALAAVICAPPAAANEVIQWNDTALKVIDANGQNAIVTTSFSQAARESADSRVYAGIHFRSACEDGLVLGRKIGLRTATLYLQPAQK